MKDISRCMAVSKNVFSEFLVSPVNSSFQHPPRSRLHFQSRCWALSGRHGQSPELQSGSREAVWGSPNISLLLILKIQENMLAGFKEVKKLAKPKGFWVVWPFYLQFYTWTQWLSGYHLPSSAPHHSLLLLPAQIQNHSRLRSSNLESKERKKGMVCSLTVISLGLTEQLATGVGSITWQFVSNNSMSRKYVLLPSGWSNKKSNQKHFLAKESYWFPRQMQRNK